MDADWICPDCGRSDADPLGPGALCPHDGRVLVPGARLAATVGDSLLGRVLGGQYAVYDLLGRGGMGAVYKALHLRLRRHVAIKTILPARSEEDAADLHARFEQEARMLSELRSPGIVTVHDYGEEGDALYMVLELIEGHPLSTVLHQQGRLAVDRAVIIARQLIAALAEAHHRGLIHRDIKPSNIMLEARPDGSERVVLIDFGVAKARPGLAAEYGPTPRTQTGVAVGTPRYMAPEQLADGELGPWTDHYAVAVVLYRMLAGRTPFEGKPAELIAAHLRDPVPPLPADLSAFDAFFAQAMAKPPAERFPNATGWDAALAHTMDVWRAGTLSAGPTMPMAAVPRMGELPRVTEDFTPLRGVVEEGSEIIRLPGAGRARRMVLTALGLLAIGAAIGFVITRLPVDRAPPLAARSVEAPVVDAAPAAVAVVADAAVAPTPPAAPDAAVVPAAPPPAVPARAPVRSAPTRTTAPKKDDPQALVRTVEHQVALCRCGDAERSLARLRRADARLAAGLDERYTMACGLVGLGCLSEGGGADSR